MTFQERSLFDQGHFYSFGLPGHQGGYNLGLTVCKTAGGKSYTDQNGKEEGEAIGNLDRRLEWKTIHVGADTTEQVQGVP